MTAGRIRGLACPYNVKNSYDETMAPGAFDAFLYLWNVNGCPPLPMGLMHTAPCGVWDKLWTDDKGLRCEGEITNPIAAVIVMAEGIKELSISWAKGDADEVLTAARAATFAMEGISTPRRKIVPAVTEHADVALAEISLVTRGAFDGTHFEPVT